MLIVIPTLHYYPDYSSGADRIAFEEAKYLAAQDHEVWLIAQDISRQQPTYVVEENMHVLRYQSPKLNQFDPRRIWFHQVNVRNLLSRYLKRIPELIHGHSPLPYAGALELYGNNTVCCYSVHSPVKPELESGYTSGLAQQVQLKIAANINNRIERRCLEKSDRITVFSNYTKSIMKKYHDNVNIKDVSVISGWVDMEFFRILPDREAVKEKLGWRSDVPVLFTLRRLVPRMGLDRLIDAARLVKEAGYEFQIVIGGNGPLRSELDALIRKYNLEDYVLLIGFVPEKELPLMYGAADVFILPTTELECFGIIALEALACGRPVLATPVAAITEMLNRFEPQWLSVDESSPAIAKIIIAYFEEQLPTHEPMELRRIVGQEFERVSVLKKMEKLLSESVVNS